MSYLMQKIRYILLLLTTLVITTILTACSGATNAKIVFTSSRDGNREIYVMNADGSNQTRITNNVMFEYVTALSPDGTKIAFVPYRVDGNCDIYVINADGSNQTRLADNVMMMIGLVPAWVELAWSPDGTKIAFVSSRDGNDEIYVMNAAGSNQIRLTNNTVDDLAPIWSPPR